ncbi:hypothetical protein D3C81_1945470 [compost metagenome]
MFVSGERLVGAQQKNDSVGVQMHHQLVFDLHVHVVDKDSFLEPGNWIREKNSVVLNPVHEQDENRINPRSLDQ